MGNLEFIKNIISLYKKFKEKEFFPISSILNALLNYQKDKHLLTFWALKANQFEILKYLIEDEKQDINTLLYKNDTLLHLAAKTDNLFILKWLIKNGIDYKKTDLYGYTFVSYLRGESLKWFLSLNLIQYKWKLDVEHLKNTFKKKNDYWDFSNIKLGDSGLKIIFRLLYLRLDIKTIDLSKNYRITEKGFNYYLKEKLYSMEKVFKLLILPENLPIRTINEIQKMSKKNNFEIKYNFPSLLTITNCYISSFLK